MDAEHTDYLIVGAGAVGLAFADTILTESDATVTIVDRNAKPGGHWNDAYSFVRLHQPSAFYGVNSVPLGENRKDESGTNAGYYELASGPEVLAYFANVLNDHMLPTGRVRYMPRSEYRGNGKVTSLETGKEIKVAAGKVVDATYYGTTIPATHTPKFDVAEGVKLVPPNDLPDIVSAGEGQSDRYVILGGGKTAMDAGVWLIESGIDPDAITWVLPRDSWCLDRHHTQPGMDFFNETFGGQAAIMEATARAENAANLFELLEDSGVMIRIHTDRRPDMYHCATISRGEVDLLRQIKHVVRQGRVSAIDTGGMTLRDGRIAISDSPIYVDCTATAVQRRPHVPVFQDDLITLQMLRVCQPTFSAALTAHLDLSLEDNAAKNRLAQVVPVPDTIHDYLHVTVANMINQINWSQDKNLREWLIASRLDGFSGLAAQVGREDDKKQAVLKRFRTFAGPAFGNLQKLMTEAA